MLPAALRQSRRVLATAGLSTAGYLALSQQQHTGIATAQAEQQSSGGGALNPQEFKPFKVIGEFCLVLVGEQMRV